MRGNWEAAEAPVLAPSQEQQQRQRQRQQREQQQQQEENIMEERGLPLRSPTTPAWNDITDGRVKEEPVEHPEDGNNDSGVSPGHYTSNSASPRSRRSSSTVNCSLSPGSATSQDSNAMQCTNFDYSPRSIYKNCDSTLDYGGTNDESNENRHSPMDVVSMSVKSGCRESEVIAQDTLRCPVCSFATFDRIEFTEHLAAHRASTSRETPDFTKSLLNPREKDGIREHHREIRETIDGTRNTEEAADGGSHPGDDRSEQESEEADEPGLRVPRVNSQGKVKKFRCKQCNFVAVTKFEFWEHSRGHIKAEKLLACPKCPFVTEYKHHLEYHLRNHFGSKPFKCDKCSYSCVNKSMLNSHSKSHSNVYQYRCANCSYATKYCHSLKLHLRKYSHRPAMVLNADGSPNPLPIIDVYGTRRGPKQKPSNPGAETREDDNSQLTNVGSPSPARASQLSPLDPMSAMHALADSVNRGLMNFPYNRLFAAFPLGNRYPLNEEATEKRSEHPKTNILVEYARAMAASDQRMIVDYPNEAGGANGFDASEENSGKLNDLESMSKESIDARRESIVVEAKTPLDLSKPDSLVNNNNSSNANNNTRVERISSNVLGSGGNSGKTTGTSRRKGRAVKLDRRVVEEESDEREEKDDDGRGTRVVGEINRTNLDNSKDDSSDKHFGGVATSNEFACQYCQIAFGNVVMYTVHMGYHGYKDPYTCNMCGHECDDKVSFFLHIARSKHS